MELIAWLIHVYIWLIIIRAILSWAPGLRNNPAVQILDQITEPVLAPIRKMIPPERLGIDISPIIAIFALAFLARLLSTL